MILDPSTVPAASHSGGDIRPMAPLPLAFLVPSPPASWCTRCHRVACQPDFHQCAGAPAGCRLTRGDPLSYAHYSNDCDEYHGLVRDFGVGAVSPARLRLDGRRQGGPRPEIVVLCGSTRFAPMFVQEAKRLTEQGVIVLSIEVVTTQARDQDPQHVNPELKARLDDLHMRKIDLADRVLVLDVGGYIGESTRNEIAYAESRARPIEYLSARHAEAHPSAMADA